MTDEEWAEMSYDEKLDWLRANIEGLSKFSNGLSGRVRAISAKLDQVQESVQTDPQTDTPGS